MYGSNPALAKANRLRSELEAKAASRKYDAHCQSCGISPLEARLLESKTVEKGRILRAVEEKKRKMAVLKAKKEEIERKF